MFKEKDLPVDFAGGIYRLTQLVGTGGMAAVYAADVDLDRFDYATVIAHHEQKVGESRAARAQRREKRLVQWRKKSRAELRAVCDGNGLPYPRDGRAAVKLLFPHLAKDSERFQAEWQSMVALSHPNVVQVYEGGKDDAHDMHYYAMELLEGILDVAPLPVSQRVEVFRQAACGLQYLHENGLVHRDIKPGNIVCTRDSTGVLRARVTDLGIAKDISRTQGLTMTNSVMGTPFYMAPEQANSARAVTHLSDVYSLGATLYFWLCGRAPFQGLSLYMVLAKLATGERPEPIRSLVAKGVPESLTVLIDRMMDPDPGARPPSMLKVVEVVQQLDSLSLGALVEALRPLGFLPPTLQLPDASDLRAPAPSDSPTLIPASGALPATRIAPGPALVSATSIPSAAPVHDAPADADEPSPGGAPPRSRRGVALVGAAAALVLLAAGGWALWGRPPAASVIPGPALNPSTTPNATADALREFVAQRDAVERQSVELTGRDAYDEAVAALRSLAGAASAVDRDAEVRGLLAGVEARRAKRVAELEREIDVALAAPDARGAEAPIDRLARVDGGHPRLRTYRDRLAQQLASAQAHTIDVAAIADLVTRIEAQLPSAPDRAQPLIDQLAAKDPSHPRLAPFRAALAEARAMATRGDAERTEALTARESWRDLTTQWPVELCRRFALEVPPAIQQADQGLAEGIALLESGQRDEGARKLARAGEDFTQGRAAFLERARQAAIDAHGRLAAKARTWDQVKRRLQIESEGPTADAERNAVKAGLLIDQGKAREVLVACNAAEPVLAAAIDEQVAAARTRAQVATAAWTALVRERELATTPTGAKRAAEAMARADAATLPLEQIEGWTQAIEGYREATAEATYVPANLPFQLPAGWSYLRQNAAGYHEVRSAPDRATMVWIPRGKFVQGGCDPTRLAAVHGTPAPSFADELPEHEVELSEVFVDTHEVTCASYARFLAAKPEWTPGGARTGEYRDYLQGWTGAVPPAGFEQHPVVWVPWEAARAYATWAGKRLPTEAEWERAARGLDGRAYPWGTSFEPTRCNSASHWTGKLILTPGQQRTLFLDTYWKPGGSRTLTQPVGTFPTGISPCGLLDMAGNAMEWCEDGYAADFYERAKRAPTNPLNQEGGTLRVVRGGSWMDPVASLRTTHRQGTLPALCDRTLGFRCARSSGRP